MDFWRIPKEKIIQAAQRKSGKEVKEVIITSGLFAWAKLVDGSYVDVYDSDMEG